MLHSQIPLSSIPRALIFHHGHFRSALLSLPKTHSYIPIILVPSACPFPYFLCRVHVVHLVAPVVATDTMVLGPAFGL